MDKYRKVEEFLTSRGLNGCVRLFVLNKIDDEVAPMVEHSKLIELGLAYGDIVQYRALFKTESAVEKSYHERAEELKSKLKRKHSGKNDSKNRPISIISSYRISVGLKCRESNEKYTLKNNKSCSILAKRDMCYNEVHDIVRKKYNIRDITTTFLGDYKGKNLSTSFLSVESYSLSCKEKKRILQVYLYYPHPYRKLTTDQLLYNHANGSESETHSNEFDDEQIDQIDINHNKNLSEKKICDVCSRTYEDYCLVCMQNQEYERCLLIDRENETQLPTTSGVSETPCSSSSIHIPPEISIEDSDEIDENEQVDSTTIRSKRLQHFGVTVSPLNESASSLANPTGENYRRTDADRNLRPINQIKPPIRYRHSIGSPSLSNCHFGEDEVSRFFKDADNQPVTEAVTEVDSNQQGDVDSESLVTFLAESNDAFSAQIENADRIKHIIVQREPERFWPVLLRQVFNLASEKISIRFAGEPGADSGGPLREFCTLSMQRFSKLGNLVFGNDIDLSLKLFPDCLIRREYFKLGQIVGFSILKTGRGPNCFSNALVKTIFNVPVKKVEILEDAELKHNIDLIMNGEDDLLLDNDIAPRSDREECKELYVLSYTILKNHGAIVQFKEGLASICPNLVKESNYDTMRHFLQYKKTDLGLESFMKLFDFKKTCIEGSNGYYDELDAFCDFEVFIASLANGEKEHTLAALLFLFTGLDKIPSFGLEKKIDVYVDKSVLHPSISTCGLNVTLPIKDVPHLLDVALKFGGGFGSV